MYETLLPLQHTSPNSKSPFQGGFTFLFMPFDHIFASLETRSIIKNGSACYHQFYLNCIRGWQCFAFLFGDMSQEIFALTGRQGGGYVVMVGFSPYKGSTWVIQCMKKEEDVGYVTRRSHCCPSLCVLYWGERPSAHHPHSK